jgi:TonB family protein
MRYNAGPSRIAPRIVFAGSVKRFPMAQHSIPRVDSLPLTSFKLAAAGADAGAVLDGNASHTPSALTLVAKAVDPELDKIVKQARLMATATGAAIVLVSGGERICVAKSGATAGEVVAYLNAHSAILHACLRDGEPQICDDAEAVPEFDAAVCHRTGLRSLLIVPVQGKKNMRGVLEVFSPRPRDFCDRDVAILQELARQVSTHTNIDLTSIPKATLTTVVAADVPSQPVSAPKVSPRLVAPRPRARKARKPLKLRMPAIPPIHWTLLLTLIVLPLLMGWMLGAAAAVPSTAIKASTIAATAPQFARLSPVSDERQTAPQAPQQAAVDDSNAAATPAPVSPAFIPEDVAKKYVVERVEPDYPDQARQQRIQGAVLMKVIVGKNGEVERLSRISGDAQLAMAADTAIRQWRFKPQPAGFETDITLNFALP